jgi:hypothetical protein
MDDTGYCDAIERSRRLLRLSDAVTAIRCICISSAFHHRNVIQNSPLRPKSADAVKSGARSITCQSQPRAAVQYDGIKFVSIVQTELRSIGCRGALLREHDGALLHPAAKPGRAVTGSMSRTGKTCNQMTQIFAVIWCFHLTSSSGYCHLYPSDDNAATYQNLEGRNQRMGRINDAGGLGPNITISCVKKQVPTWEPAQ